MDPQLLVLALIVIVVLAGLGYSLFRPGDEFGVRVSQWKEIPGLTSGKAYNPSARRVKLDVLADLYPDADAQTRVQIEQLFDNIDQFEQLHRLISRTASSIKSADDVSWLRRGLSIAAIEAGRFEREDTVKRLAYLRQAADRVGIDARSHFLNLSDKSSPAMQTMLDKVAKYSDEEMRAAVRSLAARVSWGG